MSESKQNSPSLANDDEIDFHDLLCVLWAGKWIIGSITVAAALTALIVVLMLPSIYRAEALLVSNDQKGAGGLSALGSQYGDLASLAGISFGGGQTDNVTIGLAVLKSRKFISDFVERHDIFVPLLAAEGWDSKTGQLLIDSSSYDVSAEEWVRPARPPREAVPSLQEAYEEFLDILSVSYDMNTGLVRIAVEHYSPFVASQWVEWLIADLNDTAMRQDVAEAEQAIEYLENQVLRISLAGLQNVFFSLIEDQTRTVVLAEVTDEYLLKTIDPAIAPERKSKPRRALIVISCAFLGFLFSVLIVLVMRIELEPELTRTTG